MSDLGLVDAIESGIVKIPRLPVLDTTGRPDPKYFKLWKAIDEILEPGERLPGKAKRPNRKSYIARPRARFCRSPPRPARQKWR